MDEISLNRPESLRNVRKVFQTSEFLYKDSFALVKDCFPFSYMWKDWKLKIEVKSTLNIFFKLFLKILVHVQNSLAWIASYHIHLW